MSVFLFIPLFIDWLERHQLPCVFRQMFHVPCPGCGFQTSVVALLRGRPLAAFSAYPPLFALIAFFGFILIMHIRKKPLSPTLLRGSISILFLIILASYLTKLTA